MTFPASAVDRRPHRPGAAGPRAWRSWRGVRRIVRFNWPFYVAGASVTTAAAAAAFAGPLEGLARLAAGAAAAAAGFWSLASLVVSWIVYDRSPLMTGEWIPREIGRPAAWMTISAGFDELAPVLRTLFAGSSGRAFDIYDPALMTERSIARARTAAPCADAERASHARLPLPDGSIDAVLVAFSAHELRSHAARCALFLEIGRVSTPSGRVVVAEHLRDLPNVVAFGPGALHFHSRRTWTRCFTEAGWHVCRELSVTPFVRVFVLERSGPAVRVPR